MEFKIWFILFIIYSFIGWIIEIIDIYFETKKLVNRGFLIGPVCPIYGFGGLLIIFLLNDFTNQPIVLFILAIVICSILEYTTGYLLEKLFKIRWWDYSNKKYNINGRICLETMIPFGIIGCLLLYFINPFFLNILTNFSNLTINIIFYILFIIFLLDVGISCKVITNIKTITSSIVRDNTEEVNSKVKKAILDKLKKITYNKNNLEKKIKTALLEYNYFTKRFVKSFPRFQVIKKFKNRKSNIK